MTTKFYPKWMTMKFYPKEEDFPDDILCPLCINQKYCDEIGFNECKTILAMCDDMMDGKP
jgi:hypothetical protein